jgi:hypothetical protein
LVNFCYRACYLVWIVLVEVGLVGPSWASMSAKVRR